MKKKVLIILAMLLFFVLLASVCFALEVGKENAWITVNGWDAGLYFLVTDPQGRRAGFDLDTKEYLEEFPASLGVSLRMRNETNDLYGGEGTINLEPGTYTIEVLGTALTKYSVNIRVTRRLPGEGPTGIDFKTLKATPEQIAAIKALSTDFHFEGVIDNGLTAKYQFTYTSDPTQPATTAERIIGASDLKQDIELSRRIGWIDNDGIAKSLLKKAEAIEAAIARGDKKTAENQLNAFINEVDAQKGKHIESYSEKQSYHKEGGQLVPAPREGKAVKLLLDDAQYLLDSLGD